MLDSLPNPVACNKHNMVIDSPDRGLIVCGGLWVRDRDECGVRADGRGRDGCARVEWATNESDERASIAA